MKRPALTQFASSKNPSKERTSQNQNFSGKETKAITLRLQNQDWKNLKRLALELERSAQDMLVESLKDLFKKYHVST